MDKLGIKLIATLCCIVCGIGSVMGQGQNIPYDPSVFIKIDINSGNPAFPYPQFKEYKVGKTLAKYNAEGVTHADMEKTGREAYEIMSHRCRYSKTSQGGVKYISFNDPSVPHSTHAPHCSEGDGYMLLMSALFADQPTFNGLWMWIHDYKIPKVERYYDGQIFLPNYKFSPGLPLCYTDEENIDAEEGSATDGDDDIALAVLIAYKQWGEWMMQDGKQVLDSKGNPISYKKIAKDFLAAYVDTFSNVSRNGDGSMFNGGHSSGDIGIDGYVHGGNKGGDMTQWRQTQTDFPFVSPTCILGTPDAYADYIAPAYYNEFAKFLEEDGEGTSWQITQYKRGEASSDWLIGQAYKKGMIASAGKFSFEYGDDANVSFTPFSEGEDFRFVLRTILNYMWHGNPETTWDPVKHQPVAGENTFEKDMAERMAEFLKEPWSGYGNKAPGDKHGQCVQMGAAPDPGQPYWKGVCNIMQSYNADKTPMGSGASPAPYTLGASAAAAVCSGDLELVADMYRQSEITWDGTNKACTWDSEERYIGNTPEYFHGFYRCWGLLTHSGNLHAPQDMKREANMKVYMSVDKTYAYVGDQIEYTVQYRNYGSADAEDVKIVTELDPNYEVVSIKRGKGSIAGGKITWNVGEVPGFKTGGLDATIDSVSFIVVVKDTLNPRICLTSEISGSNFENWVSNEYPNHATYTMERNCVDIVPDRTLQMKKKASRKILNPNDAVTFTIEFENKSLGEASWLNGGRDHVRLSYANYISGTEMFQGYRFWNDAYEAYINPGNYRVSYFMYDAAAMGLYSAKNPTGWDFTLNNANDCYKYLLNHTPDTISFHYQRVPSGEDEHGRWNQRLMVQFADFTMAPSSYTFNKIAERPESPTAVPGANNFYSLHKGIGGPTFIRTQLRSNPHLAMEGKVKDDWSYKKLETKDRKMDMQTSALYLLTPCYADVNNLGYEVDIHARNVCYTGDIDMTTYDRMLVEEFDGYTWRRILGRAPLPGRECMNVQIVDTIPYELIFHHWIDSTALKNDKGEKIQATYTPAPEGSKAYSGIIKWSVPSMLVGEKDKLSYVCVARDMGCPEIDDVYYNNVAWISSETDSPDSSRVTLMTTCSEIPPVGDEQESLFKSADKKAAMEGETVEYKVKYINNTGTHVEADCKSTTGWKALGSSTLPSLDGGKILLNTDGSHLFAPEYSYGNNGDVYFQLDRCTNAIVNTYVVLRWTAGTPGKPDFKGAAVKVTPHASLDNTFKCEVYDNGTCIAKEGEGEDLIIYPGDGDNPEFKFTFVDDHLFMYINNADDEWVDVMKDWKGMAAAGPGYFGMYVDGKTNSAPHLTKFVTDLDYAFNVTLYDQLPEELGNVTGISDEGTWDESKNFITWPMVATTVETAIAPMDSVIRTYSADVVKCVDKYITNMGIATVYGLDTMKVLNTIECGSEECDLTNVVAKIKLAKICEGDSTVLKAIPTPKSNNYTYEFFNGRTSLTGGKTIKADSIFVSEAGSYSVIVHNENIKDCMLHSDTVKLMVNPLPTESLDEKVALCDGEPLDLGDFTLSGYDIKWYSGDVANSSFEVSDLAVGSDALSAYFYTLTDANNCVSKPKKLDVVKDAIPDAPTVTSPKEFAVGTGKEDITNLASAVDARVVWYNTNTSTDSLRTPLMIPVANDDTLTYYVSSMSKAGCESERVAIEIYITSSNKPKTSDTTLCIGETVDVTTLVTPDKNQTLIWCDENGNAVGEPTAYEGTAPGVQKYYVKQSNGTAESDIATITITTMGVGIAKTVPVTYCEDVEASKLVATTDSTSLSEYVKSDDASKYEWYLGDEKLEGASLVPSTSRAGVSKYKVVPTYTISNRHVCKGDTVSLDVTVKHVNAPTINNVVSYTLADTLPDGTFKDVVAQDPNAISGAAGMTLVWHESDKSEITSAPVPVVDKSMTTDVSKLYYVSQRDEDGCESALSDVEVIISLTPVPKTKVARYCEGVAPDPIESFVEKSGPEYSLKWYTADKNKGGLEMHTTPIISTTKTTSMTTDTATYYVCQVDGAGKESSTVPVKVILYARPILKTHFDTVCSKNVSLGDMWTVSNDIPKVFSSYTDSYGAPSDSIINTTGHYSVLGYFLMPNDNSLRCESDSPQDIYVEIHKIDDVTIEGPESACPGGTVDLSVKVEGEIWSSQLVYVWNENNNSTSADNTFKSDALTAPTTFEVTVSDGFCTKSAEKTVKIGNGKIDGDIIFEEGTNTEAIAAHGDPITFFSCGEEFHITAALESKVNGVDVDDFEWNTGWNGSSISSTTPGRFTVTFTNGCQTSQEIVVVDASIKNLTVGENKNLCEGASHLMSLDFTSSEDVDIEWYKDGDKISTSKTVNIASAEMNDAGIYTYKLSSRDVCVISEPYGEVKVFEAPKYTKVGCDTVVCEGSEFEIGLSTLTPSTAKVEWVDNETLVATGNKAFVSPTEKTVYQFRVYQDGGCELKDSIEVDVEEQLVFAETEFDTIVCASENSLRLSAKLVSGSARKYTWTDENDEVISSSPVCKVPVNVVKNSVYKLAAVRNVCPPANAKFTVDVVGAPMIESVDQKGYREVIIVPSHDNTSASLEYSIDDKPFQKSETFEDLKYGAHTATVVDEYGCMSKFLFETVAPGVDIPVVITPNGDGDNDAFISNVISEAYPDAVVTIYDRFGKKLTEIKGSESWDGTYLGHKMPSTDYWYEIWIDEIRKKYVGHFTLIND